MYRIISEIFIVFLLLLAAVSVFLFNGFTLDNLSFNNINISQLYIKYDKKLIVNLKNISIKHSIKKKEVIDANFTIEQKDKNYIIDIKKVHYITRNLKAKGFIDLNTTQVEMLLDNELRDVKIQDFDFSYDKKAGDIKAEAVYVSYINDDIVFSFDKPKFDGMDITNTVISLQSITKNMSLNLDIHTKQLLNKKPLALLKYYKIDIPVYQNVGKNKIHIIVNIPFSKEKVKVYVKAKVQKAKVNFTLMDLDIDVDSTDILYKDKIISINANHGNTVFLKQKLKLNEFKLNIKNNIASITSKVEDEYKNNIFLDSSIDINKSLSHGEAMIKTYKYKDLMKVKNQKTKYTVNYKDLKNINVILHSKNKAKVEVKKEKLTISDFNISYLNGIVKTTGKVKDRFRNTYRFVDRTDIEKEKSLGKVYIDKFKYEDKVSVRNQMAFYRVDFKKDFMVDVNKDKNFQVKVKDELLNLKYLSVIFKDNTFHSSAYLLKDKNNYIMTNEYEFNSTKTKGAIYLENFSYDKYFSVKDEVYAYDISFKDEINIDFPQLKARYNINKDNRHSLYIGHLDKILKNVSFLKLKKYERPSNLKLLFFDDFKEIKAFANFINVDIDSKKIISKNRKLEPINLPKIDLKLNDSFVSYDEFGLDIEYSSFTADKDNIYATIKPKDEAPIIVKIKDKNYDITANGASHKIINSFTKLNKMKSGYGNLHLTGNLNKFKGKLILKDTVIQDVAVVTNLITFINTTPALYNPLLILPTLFRLGETGFDFEGYYIKEGEFEFDYNMKSKYLNISSINTQGKMGDFTGRADIDFRTRKILSQIRIKFLKDYSKVIKNIPLLGYLILGDDGSFNTDVDIKGDFDEQNFTTNTVEGLTSGVFNVIKRTISIPLLPFDLKDISDEQHEKNIKMLLNGEN